MTTTTDDQVDAWLQVHFATARREAQDSLAASAARLRALAQHLDVAATKPDPYHWLATTPVPGRPEGNTP